MPQCGSLPFFCSAAFSGAGFPILAFTARGPLASRAAAFRSAAAYAASSLGASAVALAGHSMGARAATAAAAGWAGKVGRASLLPPLAALVLISYPLHPPGDPAAASKADRGSLLTSGVPPGMPALVVRGDQDAFCTEPVRTYGDGVHPSRQPEPRPAAAWTCTEWPAGTMA